jgi:phosphoribosyl-AMP cyclohydrolase
VFEDFKFDQNGLITAVAVDADTNEVLMVAYMNREALEATMKTKKATYWSRSRQKYWVKGETSGHTQEVVQMLVDCDKDCLVLRIRQRGAACHEGYRSCFFREVKDDGTLEVVARRLVDPETVYKKK